MGLENSFVWCVAIDIIAQTDIALNIFLSIKITTVS